MRLEAASLSMSRLLARDLRPEPADPTELLRKRTEGSAGSDTQKYSIARIFERQQVSETTGSVPSTGLPIFPAFLLPSHDARWTVDHAILRLVYSSID